MDRQIETVSGEWVDAEILEQTSHDPRLDYYNIKIKPRLTQRQVN